MKAGWAAGGVRARAMAQRRYGAGAARSLASCGSLPEALDRLASTPYAHQVRSGMTLSEAQHAVTATTLWHYRVLSGWVPSEGVQLLRVLAAGFEIVNVDRLLDSFAATSEDVELHPGESDLGATYQLGALATAWPRLAPVRSAAAMRTTLAQSSWGDPGQDSSWAVRIGMRLAWAHRAVALLPSRWVLGAAALLVARERFAAGHELVGSAREVAESLLGVPALAATSLPELVSALPRDASWPLSGVTSPSGLWLAEAGWWKQVERDAFHDLRTGLLQAPTLVGAAAVLGVDAWRVRAALEVAARGGTGLEVFDVVA